MTSARFSPYFTGEWHPPSSTSVAYIRVRVTKERQPDGSITVFLPDGTALDMRGSDLLRFEPAPEPNPAGDRSRDPALGAEADSDPADEATRGRRGLIASSGTGAPVTSFGGGS